jgi:hypothetical protein
MTLKPTVDRLMANVTASDPLALPMKAAVVARPPSIFDDCAVLAGDQGEEQCEGQKMSPRKAHDLGPTPGMDRLTVLVIEPRRLAKSHLRNRERCSLEITVLGARN